MFNNNLSYEKMEEELKFELNENKNKNNLFFNSFEKMNNKK